MACSGCKIDEPPSMRSLLVALVLLESTAARAEDHRAKAIELYERGAYAEAAGEFRKAYESSRDADLLYNIGQAERLSGRCQEALRAYREYLTTNPQPARRENTILNI